MKSNNIEFYPFVHEASSTISYLLLDQSARVAVVIDPAADFNILTGELDFTFCCEIENIIQNSKCQLQLILETHVHADHVTGAQYLKSRLGVKVGSGCSIREVQEIFSMIFMNIISLQ